MGDVGLHFHVADKVYNFVAKIEGASKVSRSPGNLKSDSLCGEDTVAYLGCPNLFLNRYSALGGYYSGLSESRELSIIC